MNADSIPQENVFLSVIPRRKNMDFPHLSYAQERMWFLSQLLPNSPLYNVTNIFELEGPFDRTALEQSLSELIRRHESLRTTFRMMGEKPVQVISPAKEVTLFFHDLTELQRPERDSRAEELVGEISCRIFDLCEGPLFRVLLLRLAEEKHILLFSMHHIVCDGSSFRNLFYELSELYNSALKGKTPFLPDLPVQYADFSEWQRSWLRGEVLQTQIDYWKKQLDACPSILKLPYDRSRPSIQTYKGAQQSFSLPHSMYEALIRLGHQNRVTLYITLLAAFNALLHRYSGQDDFLIGTTIANRTRTELEGMIGFFVNTLVMRGNLKGDPTFRQLLLRTRETALDAYSHQDLPFERLIEEVQPERLLGQTPLFQIMFDFQKDFDRTLNLNGLHVRRLQATHGTSKFDLSLAIVETRDGLVGTIEYSTDLFDEQTISRMVGHFQVMLHGSIANPDTAISKLPVLTETENYQLLQEWNETNRDYPAEISIHRLFEMQVENRPDAPAVIFHDAKLTYRELNRRANRLSRRIESCGIKPDAVVGFCLERSTDMIVTMLAILKAGAAYVPLDSGYPSERLGFLFEDSGANILITTSALVGQISATDATNVILLTEESYLQDSSDENLDLSGSGEDVAYVMYTSGSTGKPKAVCIPHRAVNRLVCNTNYVTFSSSDRVAQISSSSFDALTFEVWGALLNGACVVGITKDVAISPGNLAQQLRKDQITTMFLTSSLFNLVAREVPDAFSSLGVMIIGGEALEPKWIAEVLKHGAPARLLNGYGPTESTTFAAFYEIARVAEGRSGIPIGRPISNTQIYILNEHLAAVPIGVSGEIFIGGAGLAKGYLNRPELTAEKFIQNPFSMDPSARLYRTGDIARFLPDGNIEFIGRVDRQVKIRGYRVELEEIEAALSQHSGIQTAIVLLVEDTEGKKRLIAYLVASSTIQTSITDIQNFLKTKLPDYMIPAHFLFVDSLPVGPGGKIDYTLLPLPGLSEDIGGIPRIQPRSPMEESIAAIWKEVLGINEIGIDENFFDLGGHSLLITQVISRIRHVLGVDLPLMDLFEAPTIKMLAEKINRIFIPGTNIQPATIRRVPRTGELPLSFSQQRLWFLDQLAPGNPFYNVTFAIRLKGLLNAEFLQRSLKEIVRRHEVLRTSFPSTEGRPVQIIDTQFELKLPIVDVRTRVLAPDQDVQTGRNEIIRDLVNEEGRRSFDLAKGPLFHSTLLQLSEEDHVLLLNWHHIIFDGWSLAVFKRELMTLYSAFVEGRTSPLPELQIQYVDFAEWQRQRLQGEALDSQLSYWTKQLHQLPPFLDLPADRPRPLIETFRGSSYTFFISKNLRDALSEFSRREGATLFMTLVTAFMALLHRYSAQEDIVVGSPIANRNQGEIESLLGFFVNTLVLRGNFSDNCSFREALKRMRQVCLEAFTHQDLPFEKLVEKLQPERSLSRSPLFQVMFILQNVPAKPLRLPGLVVSEFPVERGTAGYDLKLSMADSPENLSGSVEYNTDLFDPTTIQRMVSHLQNMLEGIITAPESRISELPLLSISEKKQMQVEWNNTRRDYPLEGGIHQLFEEQAEQNPESVAIIEKDRKITSGEINRRSNQLAHHLKNTGVRPETVVAICMDRSIDVVVSVLGIWKAGGAYLPLDPTDPQERIAFLLQDSHAQILITNKRILEKLPKEATPVALLLDSDSKKISEQSVSNPAQEGSSENLAYVLYTSGSTGKPKGVLATHRATSNRFHWMWEAYPFQKGEVCCQKTSLGFVDSVWEIFGPLVQGIPSILIADEDVKDPRSFIESLSKNRVTRIVLVPSLLSAFLDTDAHCPQLKLCISSGEPLSADLSRKFYEKFPQATLLNLYGSTEVAGDVTFYQASPGESKQPRIPIGTPIANTQIYLLDKHLNPVPVGVPGELHVGGASLARGYLNRPELTAQKFIPNPFNPESESRLYRTGDLARYLPDGTLDLVTRIDSQIKMRGYRIEPAEVELALMAHPKVRECVVICRNGSVDTHFSGNAIGDAVLTAYVVPKADLMPDSRELRLFLREKLPEFMVPSLFVMLERLPYTASRKLDRKALPVPVQEPPSGEERNLNAIEQQLLEIWREILPVKSVGVNDNFFDLGGHSLMAVRLVASIERITGSRLPLAILFHAPTIAQLAVALAQQDLSKISFSLIPIQAEGSRPPLFCVPGIGGGVIGFRKLAPLLGKEQPIYGLQAVGFEGEQPPHKRIDQMAAHFIREMRHLQPHGPYHLLGASFGGLVAFEIAQQLHSSGESVALLAMLDAMAKGPPPRPLYLSRVRYHLEVLSELSWNEKLDYLAAATKRHVNGSKNNNSRPRGARRALPYSIEQVREWSRLAAMHYTLKPYPGRITVFRATLMRHVSPDLDWGPFAGGGLELHSIPAVHAILAREGSVRILSRKLGNCLDRALQDTSKS